MENSIAVSSYISEDIYPIWESKIKKAKSTLLIVSPYFNSILFDLIESSSLNRKDIRILTVLSLDIADVNQLLVAIKLTEMGVQLRGLPRLHAKLLVVDGKDLTLGSQNFTLNGRRAKEASVSTQSLLDNSKFLDSIDSWWEEATSISSNSLTKLLEDQQELLKSIEKFKEDADRIFDKFYHDNQPSHRGGNGEIKIIDSKESQELEREIYAKLSKNKKIIEIAPISKLGEDFDQFSKHLRLFYPCKDTRIHRCMFYPMFIPKTNRMIYVKSCKTVISYIGTGITRPYLIEIEGIKYTPTVTLSDKKFNISVELIEQKSKVNSGKIFNFNFNGYNIELEDLNVGINLKNKLEKIIFEPFYYKYMHNSTDSPENFFPFETELKIKIKKTICGFNILECSYDSD